MPAVANFLDTNILVYAFGEGAKSETARSLMSEPFVLSVQALNEFANVGRKKFQLSWSQIEEAVDALAQVASRVVSLEPGTTRRALDLAGRYNLSFYDALMLASALEAGCARCYSEDMQSGLVVERMLTIVDPFR